MRALEVERDALWTWLTSAVLRYANDLLNSAKRVENIVSFLLQFVHDSPIDDIF